MDVIILIPVYKSFLSESERNAFKQTVKIFGSHQIELFGPKGLEISEELAGFHYNEFPAAYFESIGGYSNLLLSPSFYEVFLSHRYILICQLDVWVFKDELLEWLAQDFDYVGAPWLSPPPLTGAKPVIDIQKYFVGRVGNGGFSLRKVQSHYRITRALRPVLQRFRKNEDMFWGLIIDFLWPFFKKPKAKDALSFAVEMDGQKALSVLDQSLPMAVHAWEKYDLELWKSKIKNPQN